LYRLVWPAKAVSDQYPDWRVDIFHPESVATQCDVHGRLTHVKGMNPLDYDVVILQRVGVPGTLALIDWCQNHGIAVVVDADDALWAVHRNNAAYASWNGAPNHWRHMDTAAQMADMVTVTTEGLARRYAKHNRLRVLPNRVPEAVLGLKSIRADFPATRTFGWSGLVATHPEDPQVIREPVRRIVEERDFAIRIVGDAAGVARSWGLDRSLVAGESAPLERYHQALTALDVGMVPLANDQFNRSKSSLKALEMSAVGIPVVASPTPANRAIVKDLPVILADTPQKWYEAVTSLLDDPDGAAELGALARVSVKLHDWTIERRAGEWAASWKAAADRRANVLSRAQ
jgi:glycosyltransferase involved in cell wall biosynthesis